VVCVEMTVRVGIQKCKIGAEVEGARARDLATHQKWSAERVSPPRSIERAERVYPSHGCTETSVTLMSP
jgi:hypothetical protein